MKKIVLAFLFLCILAFTGSSLTNVFAAEDDITVKISTIFEEGNEIGPNNLLRTYGSKVGFTPPGDNSGYDFVFWVVNGIVRKDLELTHQFTVTSKLDLVAIYAPNDPVKHAVVFMDSNGELLEVQYVAPTEDATDLVSLPDKPGYEVSTTNKWKSITGNATLTNIASHTVFVLQYQSTSLDTFDLVVNDGHGAGNYAYNSLAEVSALVETPNPFSHWEENGIIVSYDETYMFTMASNRELTAVYLETPLTAEPLVTMTNDLGVRDGYHTYMGQFSMPDGYELIEYGYLVSDQVEVLTLDTPGVEVVIGNTSHPVTNEFVTSFVHDSGSSIRAYMVVNDGETIVNHYSDNKFAQIHSGEVVIYETGFESSEGFTHGTTYNNTTVKMDGPTEQQWGTYYGTASTTSPLSGAQSMQMRWYTSAPANLGYTFTDFDLENISKIEFFAANELGLKVEVSVSIDEGDTWIDAEVFALTGTSTQYTYFVEESSQVGTLRVKFQVSLPEPIPTGTSRLYIDDVKIYSVLDSESKVLHEVIFNNEEVSESVAVVNGNFVSVPEEPTKTGYNFLGWFDESLTTEYTFDTPLTEDFELFAKWVEVAEELVILKQFDFGAVNITGYAGTEITFTNVYDSVEYTLTKLRGQINTFGDSPAYILSPHSTSGVTSYIEFDLSDIGEEAFSISFDYTAWSSTAVNNIKNENRDSLYALQFFDGTNWISLTNTDSVLNLKDTLTDSYQTVTYEVTEAGFYRVILECPGAGTTANNTAQAGVIDNFTVFTISSGE
jgi:uncharacterized repeat protein (TIGR02543 family)